MVAAIIGAMLLASAAIAAVLHEGPKHFSSADEVAIAVLTVAYERHPHYYEYGGVIVKTPSGFNASAPVTIGHADNMQIDEDPESYDGNYPVVADYHTHPCVNGYSPEVFSPADLHSAREVGRGSYILDECTGDVRYWAPGDAYAPDTVAQIAYGRVVGHITVDGKAFSL
jgi:hypothetical protein